MNRRVRKRLQPTLGDYLAIAVGPVLIGLLVGSMVFFLIEVFYQGQFGGRLQFIMAWFVVGAVGIGRISIEEGREHAALFAAPLGILVAIAALKFVEFSGPLRALSPVLSVGLVALIWWSTDCLTWDCTVVDDDEEDDSRGGLLETAGLEAGETPAADLTGTTEHASPRKGIWERFVEYRRRPHAPGVWVLYFSLAALPLFGLGQMLLPADNDAVRRRAFLLLVVYVASGLGLLLVTSFLNLRRYLRQRRLTMPPTMAAAWVVSGGVLIAGILLVCLILAGQGVGYAVSDLPVVASIREGLQTSRWATGDDGPEEDQGQVTQTRDDAEQLREGDAENELASGDAEPDRGGKGEPDEQTAQQRPTARQQQPERESDRNDTTPQQAAAQQQEGDGESQTDRGEQRDENREQAAAADAERQQREDANEQSADASADPATPPELPEMSWSGDWLKMLGWLLLVIVLGVVAWWYRSAIAAALRGLLEALAAFWARLFGGLPRDAGTGSTAAVVAPPRRKTFAEFADPFATGNAERVSTDELIRYSFEAFEAWSGDRGFRRRPQQTAHEFAEVVGERLPAMDREARQLAELVSLSAFSGARVPRSGVKPLARLWKRMRNETRRGSEPAASTEP
jgi:hypothetical protein